MNATAVRSSFFARVNESSTSGLAMGVLALGLALSGCGSSTPPARSPVPRTSPSEVLSLRPAPETRVVDACGPSHAVAGLFYCFSHIPADHEPGVNRARDGAEVSVHLSCGVHGGATWFLNVEIAPYGPGCSGSHSSPVQVLAVPSPLALGVDGLARHEELLELYGARRDEDPRVLAPAFELERVAPEVIERLADVRLTPLEARGPFRVDVVEPGHRVETSDGVFSVEVVAMADVDGSPGLVLRARSGRVTMLLPGRLDAAESRALVERVCGSTRPCPALEAHILHLGPSCEPVTTALLDAVDPSIVVVHRSARPCDRYEETRRRVRAHGARDFVVSPYHLGPSGSRPTVDIRPSVTEDLRIEVLPEGGGDPIVWRPDDAPP